MADYYTMSRVQRYHTFNLGEGTMINQLVQAIFVCPNYPC